MREYNKIQNQMKFEPPDSPTLVKMKEAAKKLSTNINNIIRESKNMKKVLNKVSFENT